jgi:pantetheine-phosphate adenylyltransferase
MTQTTFYYPGTFSPPTYGHRAVARSVAMLMPGSPVKILCSENPDKDPMFSPAEAKRLWSAYDLPSNVEVITFDEMRARKVDLTRIVMIRGIRGEGDLEHENRVALENYEKYGIRMFMNVMADRDLSKTSSSVARGIFERGGEDHDQIGRHVAPLVVTALMEKQFDFENVIIVVGRPGGGKSTVCKKLAAMDGTFTHIDTDRFLDDTKDALRAHFKVEDLATLALTRGDELKEFVGKIWMRRLWLALCAIPLRSHVLIEVPYAMKPGMDLYRTLGGKILYVGCADEAQLVERIKGRGTPQHVKLIESIPDWDASEAIAAERCLRIARFLTDGPLADLDGNIADLRASIISGAWDHGIGL